MPQPVTRSIACPDCGSRVPLPAAPAPGARVTCACGRAITLQARPAGSGALSDRVAMYGTRRFRPGAPVDDDPALPRWRETWLPGVLLPAGLALLAAQLAFRPLGSSVATGVVLSLILLALGVIVMLAGVFLCAFMMGTNFGSIGSAVLKLSATAVLACAGFAFCAALDMKTGRGPIVGWHVAILVYAACFKSMFELDWQEALLTVGIIGTLQALLSIVVFQSARGGA
jgi:hypothetical protein